MTGIIVFNAVNRDCLLIMTGNTVRLKAFAEKVMRSLISLLKYPEEFPKKWINDWISIL